MVQTASATGPVKLLSAAGDELINGVKKVLSDTGEKREAIFDPTGIEFSMQPGAFVGDEIFLLMHRGSPLDAGKLTVRKSGQLLLPFIGSAVLDDGAWLLLRLRRSDEYSGVRDWYAAARTLRGKIMSLVSDVELDVVTKEDGLKQLKPSATGSATIFDDHTKLRAIIQNDGVLSEREAGAKIGDFYTQITVARKAISTHSEVVFHEGLAQVRNALASGKKPKGLAGKAFVAGITSITDSRAASRKKGSASAEKIISTVQFMPKALKLMSSTGRRRRQLGVRASD